MPELGTLPSRAGGRLPHPGGRDEQGRMSKRRLFPTQRNLDVEIIVRENDDPQSTPLLLDWTASAPSGSCGYRLRSIWRHVPQQYRDRSRFTVTRRIRLSLEDQL